MDIAVHVQLLGKLDFQGIRYLREYRHLIQELRYRLKLRGQSVTNFTILVQSVANFSKPWVQSK